MLEGTKGSTPKQLLAWWLRRRTAVGRRWIAERLGMGHETRVTWTIAAVARAGSGELVRWRKRLQKSVE